MIILNKKKLIAITTMVCLSLFSYTVIQNIKLQSIPTAALPVSDKIIVIDAGHGTPDEGASSNNGVTENQINLKIALKLQQLLEQGGSTVILTRSDENGIYELDKKTLKEKKVSDLKKRVEIGNQSKGDIFISIHLNKIPQSQYYGWQTFFKKGNEKSETLAKILQKNLTTVIKKENKREALAIQEKYIVDHVNIPIAIVECGFLSNPEEEQLLQKEDYQNQLALGMYLGIIEYFNENIELNSN